MEILIAKQGQQYGPYSEEQVREYVRAGRISPDDLAWHQGQPAWAPLSQILKLETAPPPPPVAFPGGSPEGIALWNPKAAAAWSLLFSPMFGAFLHARNWRQLGDFKRASANMIWFYALGVYMIVILAVTLTTSINTAATNSLGVVIFAIWFWLQGKPQIDHVNAAFPNGYRKKSLAPPLLIAFAALGLFFVTIVVAVAVSFASPENRAKNFSEEVKPAIMAEWRKKPSLVGARIENIALAPVNGSSTEFAGPLDAVIAGEKVRYKLKLTYHPDSKTYNWAITQ
jgi:hypothetical protein